MNKEIARIIDANINRSREGLRVCEEIARFILEDKTLSAEYKQLRHRISRLIKKFPGAHRGLAQARESQEDVGRNIPDASRRKNYHEVLLANMQRTKESLRVLEEFSAIFNRSLRTSFARVRFAVYRLEKKTIARL